MELTGYGKQPRVGLASLWWQLSESLSVCTLSKNGSVRSKPKQWEAFPSFKQNIAPQLELDPRQIDCLAEEIMPVCTMKSNNVRV